MHWVTFHDVAEYARESTYGGASSTYFGVEMNESGEVVDVFFPGGTSLRRFLGPNYHGAYVFVCDEGWPWVAVLIASPTSNGMGVEVLRLAPDALTGGEDAEAESAAHLEALDVVNRYKG